AAHAALVARQAEWASAARTATGIWSQRARSAAAAGRTALDAARHRARTDHPAAHPHDDSAAQPAALASTGAHDFVGGRRTGTAEGPPVGVPTVAQALASWTTTHPGSPATGRSVGRAISPGRPAAVPERGTHQTRPPDPSRRPPVHSTVTTASALGAPDRGGLAPVPDIGSRERGVW
ncbi:hypothetical protein EBM89_18560, partial [Cellulomonas triticagri]